MLTFNLFQSTTNDFAARSLGFIQEAMKWAPSATRSHLQHYLTQIPSSSYWHHSGLSLATESVLQSSCLNFHAAPLSVSIIHTIKNILYCVQWCGVVVDCSQTGTAVKHCPVLLDF